MNNKQKLLKLAKKNGILRMSRPNGFTVNQAINAIKQKKEILRNNVFPKKLFGMLK